jgi:integrase
MCINFEPSASCQRSRGSIERQLLGVEARPTRRAYQSFGEMLDWWWKLEGCRHASAHNMKPFIEKYIRPALGGLASIEVTGARIKEMMNARLRPRSKPTEKKPKKSGLSAASANHLRSIVHRVFAFAIEQDEWTGENPASDVAKEKVFKRHTTHLSFDEVLLLLRELDPSWRPLFATAVYTGTRQGELLGLLKSDVDLIAGVVRLDHANTSTTTKDGKDARIPIAAALRPFLEHAIQTSPSQLLFCREDGRPYAPDVALDNVLRRALVRAGVVTGYTLKCRRHGCGHSQQSAKPETPKRPKCGGMVLWPIPQPRHVRFHDLRHTTAMLLLKNNVPMQHAQKILRHSDPDG